YFNFNKLGVVCGRYIVNLYGEIRDEMNRGLPTDRFYVEWYISSDRVKRRIECEKPPLFEKISWLPVVTYVTIRKGVKILEKYDIDVDEDFVLVEIPANFARIRNVSLDLAVNWRIKTREIFSEYFGRGYVAIDIVTNSRRDRFFYVLARINLNKLLKENWWEII
ncbi:MAG: hypothetical protein Q6363_001335, partial [Candidatus Njordarchaeota archaeon]